MSLSKSFFFGLLTRLEAKGNHIATPPSQHQCNNYPHSPARYHSPYHNHILEPSTLRVPLLTSLSRVQYMKNTIQ